MYKVYENHKRKIAPQYANHKSFLVWNDNEKRIVYSYFAKGEAEKTVSILNEETATLRDELATTQAALESASERIKALEGGIRKAIEEVQWVASYSQHAEDALILLQDLLPDTSQAPVSETAPKSEKPHACYYCNGTGTDSLGLDCDFCMGSNQE